MKIKRIGGLVTVALLVAACSSVDVLGPSGDALPSSENADAASVVTATPLKPPGPPTTRLALRTTLRDRGTTRATETEHAMATCRQTPRWTVKVTTRPPPIRALNKTRPTAGAVLQGYSRQAKTTSRTTCM